jgi:hypothetical protein
LIRFRKLAIDKYINNKYHISMMFNLTAKTDSMKKGLFVKGLINRLKSIGGKH